MPRCATCAHPQRAEIDKRLAAGESERAVASHFGISRASIQRHRGRHLPATLAAATEAEEAARGDDLLAEIRDRINELRTLFGVAVTVLRDCKQLGDYDRTLKAIDAAGRAHGHALRHLELLAKLAGELDERPTINLLVAPEWLAVRAAIMGALEAHPEARRSVGEALRRLNAGT